MTDIEAIRRAKEWLEASAQMRRPVSDLAAEFQAIEREAMERACRAACVSCDGRTGEARVPVLRNNEFWHMQGDGGLGHACRAPAIRALMEER